VIFLGKRCRSSFQSLFNGACEETNPGAFHKAIVNRVGKMQKTFIADIFPGKEVWNYPIVSYQATFFNVLNKKESIRFEDVKEFFIQKNRFKKSKSRHSKTHSIVGVKLTVNFREMTKAKRLDYDGPEVDETLVKNYIYDLELDVRNNIIGGESVTNNLPDFIWAPNDLTYPLSFAEKENLDLPLAELSRISAQVGSPLTQVVKTLFELAK
jgi:hypothetical protein